MFRNRQLGNNMSSTEVNRDLRIVLLGKTGSGKSATGNTILQRKVFTTAMSPSSVTKKCKKATGYFDERTMEVVDTPGVFDTSIEEDQLKTEMKNCIMLSLPGPHVFLLVLRLDARFTKEEKNAVKWIKDNFGEEASKYTMVIFTRGDELKESIETYLGRCYELREFISSCTARYVVFDNTCRENRTQVADLFEKIDEIVQLNGGNHYTSSLYEEAQRKIESDERWRKCGEYIHTVGNSLLGAAAVTAAPAAGAAVLAEEAVAISIGSYVMLAGGGITKAIGAWMKPKPRDS